MSCYKIRNKRNNLLNNALIKDEVGQIKELLCSGIDITERKHSEEALIKVKDEFHVSRINATNCMVALPDGLNIYLNHKLITQDYL
jgi:hypothetical protein